MVGGPPDTDQGPIHFLRFLGKENPKPWAQRTDPKASRSREGGPRRKGAPGEAEALLPGPALGVGVGDSALSRLSQEGGLGLQCPQRSQGAWLAAATQWQPEALQVPERPPTSIFFRFLASRMHTVSFPAVGT